MGTCCGTKKIPKNPPHPPIEDQSKYGKDEAFMELSVEINEILNVYINREKNSPTHKNLAESNQMKHSLE